MIFKIYHKELMEFNCLGTQPIMQLLQEKGAPIKGTLFLKKKSGYSWQQYDDMRNCAYVFEVKKTHG